MKGEAKGGGCGKKPSNNKSSEKVLARQQGRRSRVEIYCEGRPLGQERLGSSVALH